MDGNVKPPQYQVFINFRGAELRNNFISHLVDALQRKEINIFTDKQEKKGENIYNLFERIKDSKIALAVFSKRYTESVWCLDELVKMSERADLGKLKVFPIFYKVPTEDVKGLKGEFGHHFYKLKENDPKLEQAIIDGWKEALRCVSGKIGLVFDDKSNLSEHEFIGSIVKDVLEMLQEINKNSSPVNKLTERGETSSLQKNSKKSLKAQKGNLVNPPKPEVISFPGSNFLAPQYIASGSGSTPVQDSRHITIQFSQAASPANALKHGVIPVQQPYTVVQTSHASGFNGARPPFNGFPVRYGNHEIKGRGEASSKANNTKKSNKSTKSNLEFTGTNGWIS